MQRPSLLINTNDPLEALCNHQNVSKATIGSSGLPETFYMPVIRNADVPTHVLAAYQPNAPPTIPPCMLPIDAGRYDRGFRVELNLAPGEPGSTTPVVRPLEAGQDAASSASGGSSSADDGQRLYVALPVVPLTVPHVASLPLLMLFGLGFETQPNLLASKLLPSSVIEEFPNAAAMAQVLARLRDDRFEQVFRYNQGMWRNVLALGMKDSRIVELVQTVWNVTAEARKIRQRAEAQRR